MIGVDIEGVLRFKNDDDIFFNLGGPLSPLFIKKIEGKNPNIFLFGAILFCDCNNNNKFEKYFLFFCYSNLLLH